MKKGGCVCVWGGGGGAGGGGGGLLEGFRFEDENEYEYEYETWLKGLCVFSKRHPGKLHFTFFAENVSVVIYSEGG